MSKRFADVIRFVRSGRCFLALLISSSVLFCGSFVVLAQTAKQCEIPKKYRDKWSEPEKWAWTRICNGQTANFNRRPGNQELDPRNPEHNHKWSDARSLRPDFLETILVHEPFQSTIPEQGVYIVGAYFADEIDVAANIGRRIDLSEASIKRPLMLEFSLFESPVVMAHFKTSTSVSFVGSKFNSRFNMYNASIGGHLLAGRAEFRSVDMALAKISGQLDLRGSKFKGLLNMYSISVGG